MGDLALIVVYVGFLLYEQKTFPGKLAGMFPNAGRREEAETVVDDPEAAETIFEALGFSPAASVRKRRERFALGEYTIALDSVTDVGQFVEVERTVETEAEIDPARDGARELLADLGLDPDDQLRTSYLALLLDARETADEQNERDGGDNRQ